MIEQICSMALTNAHHEGQLAFTWQHLVDAMTAIESGTAIGVRYVEHETRAVAIHEAGPRSRRAHLPSRPRVEPALDPDARRLARPSPVVPEGGALQPSGTSEAMGDLVHVLGAMAAEHVFYGENSSGVGGDLQTRRRGRRSMVGAAGMGPQRIELNGAKFDDETEEETRERHHAALREDRPAR